MSLKLPRYTPDWHPVFRRPWRIWDAQAVGYVRDREGRTFQFDDVEKARAKIKKLEKSK